MKVKDLIVKLSLLNQDLDVLVDVGNGNDFHFISIGDIDEVIADDEGEFVAIFPHETPSSNASVN